jgi:hypothetical protein
MTHPVESRLAELRELSKTALCVLWKEHFGTSPPTQLRRDLMIPILAYRIQEKPFGSISTKTRNRLHQLAEGFANNPKEVMPSKPTLKPGTRLCASGETKYISSTWKATDTSTRAAATRASPKLLA